MTERHHGLSLSPGQSEQIVAPGPGAPWVIGLCPAETVGLASEIPVLLCLLTDYHHCPNDWEPPVRCSCSHDDRWCSPGLQRHCASPQSTASCHSCSPATRRRSRTRPSLVGPPQLAWPGDPRGTCLCHLNAIHLLPRRSDHPWAILRPLTPGGCPLIPTAAPPAQGHLLLDIVGN